MRTLILFLFALTIESSAQTNTLYALNAESESTPEITFTENKGQISDQNHKLRSDVLYSGNTQGMVYHLRNNGISYQFNQLVGEKERTYSNHTSIEDRTKSNAQNQITIYRVDITWAGCNSNFTKNARSELPGYNNYYLEVCPDGVKNVKTYEEVSYKSIYDRIDLRFYQKNNSLKYDFIVTPGGNYKQIQLLVDGADRIKVQSDGSVLITTPFGNIQEGKPLVLQNNKQLKAKWRLNHNVLSFEIENYDPKVELIIDPAVRVWGTYYGGIGEEDARSCTTDLNGNVFMTGHTLFTTTSGIATTGSHQSTFGGGQDDAYLVKFSSSGVRQWATYYGGSGADWGSSCATNSNGDIFVTGGTNYPSSVMYTSGSHQPSFGGGWCDAFLAKFSSTGIRLWATLYGGFNDDTGNFCSTDTNGNVYVTGDTKSAFNIATLGAYQTTTNATNSDAFLAKFDDNGVRQWGTYYGGIGDEYGICCTTDLNGNVYLCGKVTPNNSFSYQNTVIASIGSHQPSWGGGADGFLAKFDSNGNRQWGTYYGGPSTDVGNGCATDAIGNVYLTGQTTSNQGTAIASIGGHQPNFAGNADAFLVKFNSAGVRQWGTYYGGNGYEVGNACAIDAMGNIYMAGGTASSSNSVIASSGSHQTNLVGTSNAFLVKFNTSGQRQWGTYYGIGGTNGWSDAIDNNGSIYMCGVADSYAGPVNASMVATIGSHQSNFGGGWNDAYLVKFQECNPVAAPANSTSGSNQITCDNVSATLTASSGTATINWYGGQTHSLVLGSGTNFITPTLSAGTYTFYAEAFGCGPSLSRTAITLTVNAAPSIIVNSGTICIGDSFTLLPSGASSYTFSSGNSIVTPTVTTSYTISSSNVLGCIGIAISDVAVNTLPIVLVSSSNPNIICSGESGTLTASGANTYSWSSGGVFTNEIITPSVTTTYSVTGIDIHGCANSTTITQMVDPCTGLKKQNEDEITINLYPNPTSSLLNVEINSTSKNFIKANVKIVNNLGQIILDEMVSSSYLKFDTQNLSDGIYTLKITVRDKVKMVKLVKN